MQAVHLIKDQTLTEMQTGKDNGNWLVHTIADCNDFWRINWRLFSLCRVCCILFIKTRFGNRRFKSRYFKRKIKDWKTNQLVTFELSHELISIVLYSNEVSFIIEKVTTDFFQQEDKSVEDLKSFLEEYFPFLVTAFHTDLVEQYERLLSSVEYDISSYQSVYPGIYRVVIPSLHIFKQILKGNKTIVRREKVWRELIVAVFEKERDKATLNINLLYSEEKKKERNWSLRQISN